MKDLKSQYNALKSLAKEMMKIGNVSEYFRLLNEMAHVQSKLVAVR